MENIHTADVLSHLEIQIRQNPIHVEPMQGDKYLLASAMQKAIRRNDELAALQAATALWKIDHLRFWRRVHISALEDIGIGNTEALVQTLVATASSSWRRRTGDLQVGLHLTRLLCQSVKNRMGDELFILAECGVQYKKQRFSLFEAPNTTLAAGVMDETRDLIEQFLSLWLLAGTRKYPSDTMGIRIGSPEYAVEVIRALKVDARIAESCIAVMNRTPWPLAILIPLVCNAMRNEEISIKSEDDLTVQALAGIPLYAADVFTRIGQTCFRKLQKEVSDLKAFSTKQIGLGVFYLEGGQVNKLLTSARLSEYRQAGEIADIESSGICLPEYMALRDCLRHNFELLQDIRAKELARYIKDAPWTI